MARPARYATDALLVALGLLLAVAVAVDVARSNALAQRMHDDRTALRAYLAPRAVDPHLVSISVHGSRDLVCIPRRGRHHARVCIHVAHSGVHGVGEARPAPVRHRDTERN